MVVLVLFAILVGFILWHYWCVAWSRNAKLLRAIPSPRLMPLIGTSWKFFVPDGKLWETVRQEFGNNLPTYIMWFYSDCTVCLLDPDDIEIFFQRSAKYIQKGHIYSYIKPFLSDGLISTSNGEKWYPRRKMLTSSFHFNILKQFLQTFIEEAEYMTQTLKEAKKPVVRNLVDLITEHTLNVICETAMGISLKNMGEIQWKYRKAISGFTCMIPFRFLRPWYHHDFLFNLSLKGRQQKSILNTLHTFSKSIIQERKKYHESTNGVYLQNCCDIKADNTDKQQQEEIIYATRKRKLAMLDLLLATQRDGNQIDDEGIREEVDTFMFAGFDTTAAAVIFLLLQLAENKEMQDRARTEVNAIFNKYEGNLTMSAVQEMEYLERCIKESLRLYPSVPYISRRIPEDLQLKKYLIPANTEILLSIYDAHRHPKYWKDPNVFNPDRFLPESSHGRHPYTFIPFSAGLRNCIGQKFAMIEIKVTTSYLLKNFYLECVDKIQDIHMNLSIVLNPAQAVYLRFIPIE